jgi:nicotinate phosphoribosyltransferase
MNGLLTDLYELTMSAGYFEAGISHRTATFELFIRRLPEHRSFVIAGGLPQVVEYLLGFRFTAEEIDYLRSLPQFARVSASFFQRLHDLRFTGDLFAVPEGTLLFAGEPVLSVRAPIMEAQIPETYLLAAIGFQTLIATKAARMVHAAGERAVIEFGTRRAHTPEAGALAGRAAYIGGCIGTSNTLTGFRTGIPVYGTAAHSWVLAFPSEREAQRRLQELLGPDTVYLIDTYDTLEGARIAASLGRPLWGVRLDSGDLVELSRAVRRILDEAGLVEAKIMASGDLNEYKIAEIAAAGAPIDAFGVGTELATSSDAPALGGIYKLVEIEGRYTAKLSPGKVTFPGAKQIYRFPDHDLVALAKEKVQTSGAEPLLRPVIFKGRLLEPLPDAGAARSRAAESLRRLPEAWHGLVETTAPYPVEYSPELKALVENLRQSA